MTDQDILELAQAHGLPVNEYPLSHIEHLKAFARAILQAASAAPAVQNEKNPWKEAIIGEGCVTHIGWDENDPRGSLQKIIRWHVQVALDPRVSSDAQALIDSGRSSAQPVAVQENPASSADYKNGWNSALDHASRVMTATAEHALDDQPRFWREAASLLLTLQDKRESAQPVAGVPEWISVKDRLPDAPLFVVRSSRDDDDATDGIDQFEGMWVVRPSQALTEHLMRKWIEAHQVTDWTPLPAAQSFWQQRKLKE